MDTIITRIESFLEKICNRAEEYKERKNHLKLFLLCIIFGIGVIVPLILLALFFVFVLGYLIGNIWLQCVMAIGVFWLMGRLILL